MCEILIIIVAIAIENPSLAAINGIIGFKKPLYTSASRCARQSHIIAFFVFFISLHPNPNNIHYIHRDYNLAN